MDGTVNITIRVRKYTWGEFVHDVCYVLYAAIMISNALSKRYLKLSLRQFFLLITRIIKWSFWAVLIGIWTYLLINGWLHPQ